MFSPIQSPIYCDIYFILPSAFDILRYILSCRAIAIYDQPINLRYIYKRVSPLLLTHLFLLLANLPGLFGAFAFLLTLLFSPHLFFGLRSHILSRCLSNFTHETDLCLERRENAGAGVFIQTLQLQSSKVSVLSIVWILSI